MTCNKTTLRRAHEILAGGDFLDTEGKSDRMSVPTIHGNGMESGEVDLGEVDEVELNHLPLEPEHAASATIVVPADRILMMIAEGTADVLPAAVGISHAGYAALVERVVASWNTKKPYPYRSPAANPPLETAYFRLRGMLAEMEGAMRGSGERHSDADPNGQDAGLEPA